MSPESHYILNCSILHDLEKSEIKRHVIKNSVLFRICVLQRFLKVYPTNVLLTKSAKGKEIIVTDYRDKMEGPFTAFKEEKVTPRSALTLLLSV